jgi:hypothetical protein
MGDAEYYRRQASFCAEMANTVPNADDKERWLRLAEQWRDLEEQVSASNARTSSTESSSNPRQARRR